MHLSPYLLEHSFQYTWVLYSGILTLEFRKGCEVYQTFSFELPLYIYHQLFIIFSFIFSHCFIIFFIILSHLLPVDMEPFLDTLGARREYTADGMPVHNIHSHTHFSLTFGACMLLGSGWKPENPEEPHASTGTACKAPHRCTVT